MKLAMIKIILANKIEKLFMRVIRYQCQMFDSKMLPNSSKNKRR
jgi:hypothetical protein